MRKGALTERQALDMVGPGIVRKLQSMQVEPTSRLYDHDDGEIEWSASLTTETIPDGVPCVATAYYYTSPRTPHSSSPSAEIGAPSSGPSRATR